MADTALNDVNTYADAMLNRIMLCVEEMIQDVPKVKSAFVDSINSDGSINVKLPGDNENVYKNIQNQSIYQDLKAGDMVKILLEDGSFSNCWVIARYPNGQTYEDYLKNKMLKYFSSFANGEAGPSVGGTKVTVSETQPTDNKKGDLWYKIIPTTTEDSGK